MESNINSYYEETVSDLAERAKLIKEECPEIEESDAIFQAMDEGLIYGVDKAYILAHAFIDGFVQWGGEIDWETITENLYEDIENELKG